MSTEPRLVADRFRMIRRLGAGAMASVFLAEDVELGRRVAIKRLHPDSGADLAPRFRREMRVAASLSHPHIVTLFDAVESDGAVLLIMEYVDGPTLAQRMRDGPLDPDDALAILRALAGAVDHLHEQGVIHRDIKPANILLDRDGQAKLTDLGIASAAQATGLTTAGTILGTPAYMAPELFEGDRATRAADVYSIAAIAFEMLSGRRAREGGTPAVIAMRATSDPPPDLREIRPEAGALADVLKRGMAHDPGARPASATALVEEIAAALPDDEPPATMPMTAAAPLPAPAPAPAPQVTAEVDADPEPERAPDREAERAAPGVKPDRPSAPKPPPPARRREPARRDRRSPALLLLAAAALAVAAIAAVVIAGGGSDPDRRASTAKRTTSGDGTTPKRTTSTATTGAASAGAASAAAGPSTPAGAVRAFYTRAAAHRYDAAWALAAPALRSQLGGFAAFRSQFSSVRSIVFARAAAIRRDASTATVAITTTATHTDHVDHCAGTADTAPASGGSWVVTHLSVSC